MDDSNYFNIHKHTSDDFIAASKEVAITSKSCHDTNLIEINDHPASFRDRVRQGSFQKSTNGCCPGYIQCNLVVLHQKDAFDFLLFCQRNPQACPLMEVLNVGSYEPTSVCRDGDRARDRDRSSCIKHSGTGNEGTCADLRTDLPLYRIYRHGKHILTTHDVTDYWPSDSVAFLIGCSFSAEDALLRAGIPLRSIQNGTNVPMYNTNISCEPAGKFKGNMVVSMKPIPATLVAKEVMITSRFPFAHGPPVCIGCPQAIGILKDLQDPDYGDPVPMELDEVPVFHACGVTPQNVLCQSGIEFAITHEPGCMFVTDLKTEDATCH